MENICSKSAELGVRTLIIGDFNQTLDGVVVGKWLATGQLRSYDPPHIWSEPTRQKTLWDGEKKDGRHIDFALGTTDIDCEYNGYTKQWSDHFIVQYKLWTGCDTLGCERSPCIQLKATEEQMWTTWAATWAAEEHLIDEAIAGGGTAGMESATSPRLSSRPTGPGGEPDICIRKLFSSSRWATVRGKPRRVSN